MKSIANIDAALLDLPIFPLGQVVLFPRALLPLHIFEPRYRAMLRDCVATHSLMAIALATGETDDAGQTKIAKIAGLGIIVEHQEVDDGRSNILLHGVHRVSLEELPFVPPYRRAKATILNEVASHVSSPDRTALTAAVNAFASDVRKRDPHFSIDLPPSLEPGAMADLYAHHLVIDAGERQRILEELDASERVRLVTEALAMQHSRLARETNGPLS
jgi:Lon protease-like protein